MLRFQIIQQVLQVFGKLFLMHSLSLVVGIFIQEADKKLTVLPVCKFDCSHNQAPYGGNIKRFFVKSKVGLQCSLVEQANGINRKRFVAGE
jgi:hypothetical protein